LTDVNRIRNKNEHHLVAKKTTRNDPDTAKRIPVARECVCARLIPHGAI